MQTHGAWFLGWRKAECSESARDTEKRRKNKGEMAKELVMFQTGLADCSGEAAGVGQEGETSATWGQLGQQCGQESWLHL